MAALDPPALLPGHDPGDLPLSTFDYRHRGAFDYEFPAPICMVCAKECTRTEVVHVGGGVFELWCYCEKCDAETFHPGKKTVP